ncbi:hypothetical protein ACNTMW_05575 [Planosporangium sp. 12N6]|uniref:hypothetical protein n=1 Tax=Planosporangium spinosum TaxID=3402278 RepID=UPI003CF01B36
MLGTQLAELLDGAPAGVEQALGVVSGFDGALAHGFARVGEDRAMALTELAGAVAATPIGARVAEAVATVIAGAVADEQLVALAGARTALLGAVHDALLGRLDAVLGRDRLPWPQWSAPGTPPTDAVSPAAGCRSWLSELAITGWRGVDHDLVAAGSHPIEAALGLPELRRMAVLLDGLAAELRACCPIATMPAVPVRRWADLWARAVLLAHDAPADVGATAAADMDATAAERVSGRLLILGVDVHEHPTAVQAQVHGVLEPDGGGPVRLVRTSVAAAKVDTVVGPALWQLLTACPTLLGALAGHRAVEVVDLPLRGSDLVWRDDQARAGEPADPFVTARVLLAGAVATGAPPLDRHPVGIAEPVLLEGYTVRVADGAVTFDLDGRTLTVDVDRLPACGPLTPELVAASAACLGLVRWDAGRWSVQPLAVQATVKRAVVGVHTGDWAQGARDPKVVKAQAKTGDAVAVLRERAGRLLRR